MSAAITYALYCCSLIQPTPMVYSMDTKGGMLLKRWNQTFQKKYDKFVA